MLVRTIEQPHLEDNEIYVLAYAYSHYKVYLLHNLNTPYKDLSLSQLMHSHFTEAPWSAS